MKKFISWLGGKAKNYWNKFSYSGLFVGALFFSASLTPSLLPRTGFLQGALSGIVFAFGYGMGCLLIWFWRYLELPEVPKKYQKNVKIVFGLISFMVMVYSLGRSVVWKNSILKVMSQELTTNVDPLIILVVAIIVAIIFIWLARIIKKGFSFLIKKTYKIVPRRVSNLIGFLIAFILLLFLFNGVLGKFVLNTVDSISAQVDGLTDDGVKKPTDLNKTGSDASLIPWDTIGRQGRTFIDKGPNKEAISSFSQTEALEPIRVYVGLNSKPTIQERAQLALAELKRTGAFDRSVLIVVSPTGTGWMDSYSMDTIEYIHNGDTAIAAVQYSYLQSPIALLVDPDTPRETAQAVFHEIYDYWTTLPEDSRPDFYLNGVSLGAFSSETSFKLHEVMDDPIQGAFWAGPPFANELWKDVTDNRNTDSPMWLPVYKDSSFVRFTGQENSLNKHGSHWGPMRIIYLQHASDPITFFSPNLFYKSPEWLEGKRGPDVSPLLRWYPGVTFFQVAFDLMVSKAAAPLGYGHNFSPLDYIDGWVALTDPPSWSEDKTAKLKKIFEE